MAAGSSLVHLLGVNAVQRAFGWWRYHLHEFEVGEVRYGDVEAELEYGFGDTIWLKGRPSPPLELTRSRGRIDVQAAEFLRMGSS